MEGETPGDNPTGPAGPAGAATTAANPRGRTFFTSTSSGEFFDELRLLLEAQHAETLKAQEAHHVETLSAQEALFTRFSTALTASIDRLIGVMAAPQRSPTSSPVPSIQREPPPIPPGKPPVSRYRSPYRAPYRAPPPPPTPPLAPVRETTAFTFATAETAASALGGSTSGIKLPAFCGKDGENVVAWLHQAERFLKLKNTAEKRKVDLVSFL